MKSGTDSVGPRRQGSDSYREYGQRENRTGEIERGRSDFTSPNGVGVVFLTIGNIEEIAHEKTAPKGGMSFGRTSPKW